ncbi:JAB domain-containing protein [Carboxydothermus ferrireducens]|uniref:DNA repair protein RadC n=1 Tax=Carboxydothermus ferrireducens DSM 11255 TaxID=1119529 RepID=A0ABX2R8F5_9THEO|nr:JAB domain-containing protein [Carboxydothermus ferrireducens]NYE57204.1 DNA repair protein RadC [Carboxydothermus ferrireducens DSM 11255]
MNTIVFGRVILVKEKEIQYHANVSITQPEDAYRIITENTLIQKEAQEIFGFLALDAKNKVMAIHEVSRGTACNAPVHPREVFKAAILYNSINIIIFHNHPSGDVQPSGEDLNITKRLQEAGDLLGIKVLDHIIIGDRKFISLKAERLM